MTKADLHSIILAHALPWEPMALAKALATVHKTPLQDQIIKAKNSWGIIAENLEESEAATFVRALKGAGVESLALPTSLVAPLPAAERAASWAALADAQPVLLAAAAVTVTTTSTKTVKEGPTGTQKIMSTAILLGTGLPIHIGGKERTVEKTRQESDLLFVLDILYGNPLRRLRVQAEHFDYSFLKERKLYQVLGNFKLLAGDLAAKAPEAWRNHGLRVLQENKAIQTMGYQSTADLERETRWLLTLKSV